MDPELSEQSGRGTKWEARLFLKKSLPKDNFIDFRERWKVGGRVERNIYVREKYRSVASHMPFDEGLNLQLSMCPDQEYNLQHFGWCMG